MLYRIKELLILVYLRPDRPGSRRGWIRSTPHPLCSLMPALYLLLAAGLLLAAWIPGHVLRCAYALALALSAFFAGSIERITEGLLTYDAFINLYDSAGFAGEAIDQFGRPMLLAALAVAALFLAIALPPSRDPPVPSLVAGAAPALAILLLSGLLFWRGGEGANGLPGAYPPLAYSTILFYEQATSRVGPTREVTMRPRAQAARDIVLVIDESVSPIYLDLASPDGVRSGLAQAPPGARIFNYGYAAAITNCSVGTNVTLRHGGTRADYQAINANMPPIWDYARKAGLRTVYIDAQRTGGQLQNLMDGDELRKIDSFVQFDGVPVLHRDMEAADVLAALLRNRTAEFVIVNKMGAHFPVQDKYPDSFMRYRPVPARSRCAGISDTGSRAGFRGSPQDWLLYRNAYRNTLLWNVGGFFDRLSARADLSKAAIIYTSDHGQDLNERGGRGVDTHCSVDPVPEEGLVPLAVILGNGVKTLDWNRHFAANRNRSSHYQVFPTLLALMGYDPAEVRPLYGDSLLDRSRDEFSFNTRFNARLGLKPVWKRIDLAGVAAAPADRGPERLASAPEN